MPSWITGKRLLWHPAGVAAGIFLQASVMDYTDWLQLAAQMNQDPLEQFRWAKRRRYQDTQANAPVNPDLANAEHYLWAKQYASKGPMQAAGTMILPPAYYLAKKLGLLSDERTSPASLAQMRAGLLGGLSGMGLFGE